MKPWVIDTISCNNWTFESMTHWALEPVTYWPLSYRTYYLITTEPLTHWTSEPVTYWALSQRAYYLLATETSNQWLSELLNQWPNEPFNQRPNELHSKCLTDILSYYHSWTTEPLIYYHSNHWIIKTLNLTEPSATIPPSYCINEPPNNFFKPLSPNMQQLRRQHGR